MNADVFITIVFVGLAILVALVVLVFVVPPIRRQDAQVTRREPQAVPAQERGRELPRAETERNREGGTRCPSSLRCAVRRYGTTIGPARDPPVRIVVHRSRRTVVLGYDGSDAAKRALFCAAHAAGSGGRVVVVTAVQPADPLAQAFEISSPLTEPQQLVDEASALLQGHDIAVSTRVEEAEPAEALVATAREIDAELIVVGARGDNYLARVLRGSVGQRLVARAPCDLLVVR